MNLTGVSGIGGLGGAGAAALAGTSSGLSDTAANPFEIFRFLATGLAGGARGALVTMTAREGSSARSLGAHMAVLENGSYAGCFSGGCLEAAIVAEAQEAIRAGAPRTVRYGKGSPYIDLRLPCGGAMELLFLPDPARGKIDELAALLGARRGAVVALSAAGDLIVEARWPRARAGWSGERFQVRHAPPLRLLIAGEGGEAPAMARLARAYGADVVLMSPNQAMVEADPPALLLHSVATPPAIDFDPWTALALLFHNHEWEATLLAAALDTPAFWIGAMGSRQTHAARMEELAARGVPESAVARVQGPVGLIPAARDPATLALSALAEIVGRYQERIA